MKHKKQIFIFVIAAAVLTLAACSSTYTDNNTDNINNPGAIITGPIDGEEKAAEGGTEEQSLPEPEDNTAVYIKATVSGVNVRSGPASSYSSLGSLDMGDMVMYLGDEGNWRKTYYRGKTAYVSALYTTLYEMEKASDIIERVIEEGARLLGTPYVYGAVRLHNGKGKLNSGFDINKFDCSSYTQYMYYYGAGVNLDLTTRTQIKQGEYVARNDIQRGDLMFFTNSSRKNLSGIERVGHVALYLGDNYILHTASDYAVIEKISSTRWGYYIETRRFV